MTIPLSQKMLSITLPPVAERLTYPCLRGNKAASLFRR